MLSSLALSDVKIGLWVQLSYSLTNKQIYFNNSQLDYK